MKLSKMTTIRKSFKRVISFSSFFLFVFATFDVIQNQRPRPPEHSLCPIGIFHLDAHCADTAGRTMSPHRRVLPYFTSYQSFLSGPARASSKYSTIPILHIFYSITSWLVKILLYVNLAYTDPIWITSTHDAVTVKEPSISWLKTIISFSIPLVDRLSYGYTKGHERHASQTWNLHCVPPMGRQIAASSHRFLPLRHSDDITVYRE